MYIINSPPSAVFSKEMGSDLMIRELISPGLAMKNVIFSWLFPLNYTQAKVM